MLIRALLIAGLMAVAVAACTSRPVMNVTGEPVVMAPGKAATNDNVRDAIVRAGSSLGWSMRPSGPGVVAGTISLRGNSATVDVQYTPKTYSIVYRSSTGLESQGGQIHKNYNGWIENLNNAIRRELLRA